MVEMQDFIVLTLAQVRELLSDVEVKVDEAYNEGFDHGLAHGEEAGFSEGVADGYDEGYEDGFADGAAEERHDAMLRAAEKAAFPVWAQGVPQR